MLLWIVKLGGFTKSGIANVQVFVDAKTGTVLATWL
jgi:hypothetical protein